MFVRTTAALASTLLILFSAAPAPAPSDNPSRVSETVNAFIAITPTNLTVPADVDVSFAWLPLPPSVRAPEPVQVIPEPAAEPPVASPAPAQISPPVAAPPVETSAPVIVGARVVNVSLAGGQNVVDLGAGPVLFPLPGYPPYVAEHDFTGGWDRFGTLSAGMQVTMTGLVAGTYTVGQIINVPQGGKATELNQFAVMPKVLLQTCIPGTNRMIVVGLY